MRSWIVVALAACGSQAAPPVTPAPAAPAAAPVPAPVPASTPEPVASESSAAPAADQPPTDAEPTPAGSGSAPIVAPSVLEARRVKGSIMIVPDDMEKVEMVKRKLTRVIHSSKVCLATDGHISSVTMLRSSGVPKYDEKIRKRISDWEYKPFEINGKPAPVCTTVTIIYNQALPEPR